MQYDSNNSYDSLLLWFFIENYRQFCCCSLHVPFIFCPWPLLLSFSPLSNSMSCPLFEFYFMNFILYERHCHIAYGHCCYCCWHKNELFKTVCSYGISIETYFIWNEIMMWSLHRIQYPCFVHIFSIFGLNHIRCIFFLIVPHEILYWIQIPKTESVQTW